MARSIFIRSCLLSALLLLSKSVSCFAPRYIHSSASVVVPKTSQQRGAKKTLTLDEPSACETSHDTDTAKNLALTTTTALVTWTSTALPALAESAISQGSLDPNTFVPVCPASDSFYRFLQSATVSVVGREAFTEYGPLIAGGLLRVRLELCVVESFVNEAVVPFVKQNGLSWILPLHETVESFLAGVIFALATTFILIGSTKIVTVIVTYTDFLLGLPARVLGGFAYDRAMGKPVTLDLGVGPFKTRVIGPPEQEGEMKDDFSNLGPLGLVTVILSGTVKLGGQAIGFIREILDNLDVFVGRYLVLVATGYILIKFLHFKVFPDFPF